MRTHPLVCVSVPAFPINMFMSLCVQGIIVVSVCSTMGPFFSPHLTIKHQHQAAQMMKRATAIYFQNSRGCPLSHH